MTREDAALLAVQYQSVDIEGFMNELIDWYEDEVALENEDAQFIVQTVIDIFTQYLED